MSAETRRCRTIWEILGKSEFEGLQPTKWWVITGGPSTGKSTLLEYLAQQGFKTMPEAARVFIDEERAKGRTTKEIRAREPDFQEVVREMKHHIEDEVPSGQLTFWDRGNWGDSLAYMSTAHVVSLGRRGDSNLYLYESYSGDTSVLVQKIRYAGVFILDRLSSYDSADDARVESEVQATAIHGRIDRMYRWLGYEPIRVPVFSPDKEASVQRRAQFILDTVRDVDPSSFVSNPGVI